MSRLTTTLPVVAMLLSMTLSAGEATYKDQTYTPREIEGWTVKVNDRMLKEKPEASERALKLLQVKLYDIVRTLPPEPVAELKKVPIWFELEDPLEPCACYHPDVNWLKAKGYDPAKAKCVQLAHPDEFLRYSIDQPWMVLHELAHAFHDRVLGFENPEVEACYRRTREAKLYDAVLHIRGKTEKHYAMKNAKEFFAEMSESYWGTNDFFPFVRAELKKHDPETFELLKKMWTAKKD
ncbi:MAG TPA: hypothetical protein VEK08_17385 [Planctomycetota bacterium]|nr:hypothetical protein [Planctomycetota bacterium]